jgi:hypothetical protein
MHISVDMRAHAVHIVLTNEDTHMAFDATPTTKPVTTWTTYEELTADQRARFGGYVKACQEVRDRAVHNGIQNARADAALKATGGDKVAALGLMLRGQV